MARAASRPVLTPVHDLERRGNGVYVSTGSDPQFAVSRSWRPFSGGWAVVNVDVRYALQPLRPVLFAFHGDRGEKVMSYRLPVTTRGMIRKAMPLPPGVSSLRLDPTETAGVEFALGKASVREVGRLGLLLHVYRLLDINERKKLLRDLLHGNLGAVKANVRNKLLSEDAGTEYKAWVELYDTLTPEDCSAIQDKITRIKTKPLISIVMPVYNPRPKYLRKALDSVLRQLYPNWQLCIADDASTDPEVRVVLKEYARCDPRIQVAFRETNGHISAASNTAIELVKGEFIALMDHDDALPVHALYLVADEIARHPDVDLIYTDEDKIDEYDRRHDAHFKTDWNPELFYAQNVIAHMGVYRTSLVRRTEGFRVGFEGSQDYDFALRFLKLTEPSRVRHIPHVLYHWRIFPGVASFSTDNPDKSVITAQRALDEYFADVDRAARVEPVAAFPGWWRIRRALPTVLPKVSLIVPTRDRLDVLRVAIDGLLHETDYDNLEVLIVDNHSVEPATLAYFDSMRGDTRVKIVRVEGEFNFSKLNNEAAKHAIGTILGFVNNDIKVIHADWLSEMVAQVSRVGVGAVGAKLYYANETIQHAGVVLGLYGVAAHGHRHFPRSTVGYFGRPMLTQNISAVTAACMLVSKGVFDEVGGYDEEHLTVGYNDVDLCLKIRAAGYSIIYTPYAELYHLESVSRGENLSAAQIERDAQERAYMLARWPEVIANDPFYSPNLTTTSENFGLAFPPRARKPWLES